MPELIFPLAKEERFYFRRSLLAVHSETMIEMEAAFLWGKVVVFPQHHLRYFLDMVLVEI
jgi:hypothetical protein